MIMNFKIYKRLNISQICKFSQDKFTNNKIYVHYIYLTNYCFKTIYLSEGFCCQVPPNPAQTAGLRLKVPIFRTAYAAKAIGALLSFATSLIGSITATPHRAKANIFRRPSILFRPLSPQMMDFGGVAGYRPRVRSAYYMRVYYHSLKKDNFVIT